MEGGGGGRQPNQRRELQGPRPTPLKVRKNSHKIKKPPLIPDQQQQQQQQPQQQQQRPPVIIYTVSPKVIHTQPSEFMSLVQRLTGSTSSSSSSAAAIPENWNAGGGGEGLSPAARLAATEKTRVTPEGNKRREVNSMEVEMEMEIERGSGVQGILTPCPPELLAPVPAGFFSQQTEVGGSNNNGGCGNQAGFFSELSPAFFSSPNFLSYHMMNINSSSSSSPTPSADLFGFFFDQ